MTEFAHGDRVKIVGERGTYKVCKDVYNKDGSVNLFGGDMDPNGVQGFRCIMPSRLQVDNRKRKKE